MINKKHSKIADLHSHTNESDGLLRPVALVEEAARIGLSALAITDHDTVNAFDRANEKAEPLGIEIIPAIELSATTDSLELHLLGYFIDPHHELLHVYLDTLVQSRIARAEGIIDSLNRHGFAITLENVINSTENGVIARPHIAEAMVEQGIVDSYQEAFDAWIGDGRPACVRKHTEAPARVIRFIHDVGGVAVLAHPGGNLPSDLLRHLVDDGLDGIEVVHPRHSKATQYMLRKFANAKGLLTTGGSDYHGGRKIDEALGSHTVSYSIVQELYGRHLDIERKNLQN